FSKLSLNLIRFDFYSVWIRDTCPDILLIFLLFLFCRILSSYSAPFRAIRVHPLHRPSRHKFFVSLYSSLVL
ncbi:hypothetical protein LINPERPRIM_LOCUS23708, partial [Linum perenne]